MERKLASIRKIKELRSIKGADLIELVIVDGWQCVTKKGEFAVGDLGVYFEIDSFLPMEPEFKFLEKSCTKKMENEVGLRLKTIRLRGELSQGLMLPYKAVKRFFVENNNEDLFKLGEDVTELLGVKKYEAPIPAQLSGQVKGAFPSFIKKTDQERIQNLFDSYSKKYSDNNDKIIKELESQNTNGEYTERIKELKENRTLNVIRELEFEESLKLDGTSCTYYVANTKKINIKITEDMDLQDFIYFGHCSRNLETKETDSTPWQIARDLKIKEEMIEFHKKTGKNIAFQGELMGPKIQGNRENFNKPIFYLFDIWDIDEQRYCTPKERKEILESFTNVKQVPILNEKIKPFVKFNTIEEILEYAKGPSISHKIREGIVFKSTTLVNGTTISFKVINNEFLLKGGS
jgi:RNA ligase (TIGR02306 family)